MTKLLKYASLKSIYAVNVGRKWSILSLLSVVTLDWLIINWMKEMLTLGIAVGMNDFCHEQCQFHIDTFRLMLIIIKYLTQKSLYGCLLIACLHMGTLSEWTLLAF